jgi:hypothetical protein
VEGSRETRVSKGLHINDFITPVSIASDSIALGFNPGRKIINKKNEKVS